MILCHSFFRTTFRAVSIVIFSIFTYSCTSVQATLLTSSNNTPEIYITHKPPVAYTEIEYIEVTGSIFHSSKQLLKKLTRKAKEDSLDAIVDVKFNVVNGWFTSWTSASGVGVKYGR